VREALEEVQTRISALALVHRNLYEHDEPSAVELRGFVADLGRLLLDASDPERAPIELVTEIETTTVPTDRAVSIALLVTEVVTNSLKHAFPDGRPGTITIRLVRDGDRARLTIADDGIGPPGPQAPTGLGMTLCRLLAKQIGGELQVEGPPGTAISVEFSLVKRKAATPAAAA
jgi:two-component sensor histidine kinase